MKHMHITNRKQQRGAALIIGLLILLVMTVIGVSALNTTTMDSRIATNIQNANIGFQVADSSNNQTITAMMDDEKIKDCALDKSSTNDTHDVPHTYVVPIDEDTSISFNSTSKVKATGRRNPFGATLNVGNANRKVGYAFDIKSEGWVAGTDTVAKTTQGVMKQPYPYVPANEIVADCDRFVEPEPET